MSEWSASASCRGEDSDLWFPTGAKRPERALTLCRSCPVRVECLKDAMDWEEQRGHEKRYGIYGGLSPAERHRIAKRRREEAA